MSIILCPPDGGGEAAGGAPLAARQSLELTATGRCQLTARREPAPPLRLAEGQLLLSRAGLETRGSGSDGALRFSIVQGGRVKSVFDDVEFELSFDSCSQAVLPWRPAKPGWYEALLREYEALLRG